MSPGRSVLLWEALTLGTVLLFRKRGLKSIRWKNLHAFNFFMPPSATF